MATIRRKDKNREQRFKTNNKKENWRWKSKLLVQMFTQSRERDHFSFPVVLSSDHMAPTKKKKEEKKCVPFSLCSIDLVLSRHSLQLQNLVNINWARSRQSGCAETIFLQYRLNLWPRSLENSLAWDRQYASCLKWQTAGGQWHALLAKYSTQCSNSADRKNIDTSVQSLLFWSESLREKPTSA